MIFAAGTSGYHCRMRRLLFLGLLLFPLIASGQAPAQYELFLVPFDTVILESGGARWFADLTVRNDSRQQVNLFPEECFFIGLVTPCTRKILVPPQRTMQLDLTSGFDPVRPGVF